MDIQLEASVLPRGQWLGDPCRRKSIATPGPEMAAVHIVGEGGIQPVEWIWPGCIPHGNLTLLAGPPGVGKSYVVTDIAARLTCGLPWPGTPEAAARGNRPLREDEVPPPEERRVVLVSAEENCRTVLATRFLQAEGIDTRFVLVDEIRGDPPDGGDQYEDRFTLDRDLHHLDQLLGKWGRVGLVIVDPIVGHCDAAETETYLHRQLSLLARLAMNRYTTVLVTSHLRHDPAKVDIYKALGSRALATVPRAIWTLQRDPADSQRRLMLPLKMNVGPIPAGVAFRFGPQRLEWEAAPIRRTASDPPESEQHGLLGEAVEFLRELLADGEATATDILEQGRQLGFSPRTIYRAKSRLKVKSNRVGFGPTAIYRWSAATESRATSHDSPSRDVQGSGLNSESRAANTRTADPLAIHGKAVAGKQCPETG